MAQENGKRSRHTGRNATIFALLLAALLGGRYGLGLGGRGGEGMLPETGNSAQSQAASAESTQAPSGTQESEEAGDDGVLSIVVKEDKLIYEGEETDLAALEQALLRDYVKDSSTVTLTDDHAIKSAYDAVTALLDRLGIPTD